MQKLEFDDPNPNIDQQPSRKRRNQSLALILCVIIVSVLVGAIGGVGGVVLVSSDNGALAQKIGLKNWSNLAIPTTKTDKVVVEESSAIIDSANKVSSAVVSIEAKQNVQNQFGQTTAQEESAGTGFIITNDGLILTNKHVVSDSTADYTVVLADGRSFAGKVQSVDPIQDLAVIKIDATNLPVVELGDSDQLQVGQWVVAVGNALGQYGNTVTVGVISAKKRQVDASDTTGSSSEALDDMLQTDAAINPGNSGGPLVNLEGQVVGINTAVASDAQSIGFAIPINDAKSAIDSIKSTGKIVRPYLGVRYVQITSDIASANNLPISYGALVKSGANATDVAVVPNSPADKAGIKENDIIEEVNGTKIDSNNTLVQLIQQYKVGDSVTLKILSGGKEKTVKVTLEQSQ